MEGLWVEMHSTEFRERFFPGEVDIPTSQTELLQKLPEVAFETLETSTDTYSHLVR